MSDASQILRAAAGVLIGDIDFATTSQIGPRLLKVAVSVPGDTVTFECGGLRFIDSAGVNMLLSVAGRSGNHVRLVNLAPCCRHVFEVLNLAAMFGIEPETVSED